MTDRHAGTLVYKCRNCGKTQTGVYSPNALITIFALEEHKPSPWPGIPPRLTEFHQCSNGFLGYAELVGIELDSPIKQE